MKVDTVYSLENERWMSIRHMVDAVVNQVLADGLTKLDIGWRVIEHGIEIDAYSREHIMAFSDATKAIEKNIRERGFDPESAGHKLTRVGNLATRKYKRIAALAAIEGQWASKAERKGLPVFAADDPRLKAAPQLTLAMTPADALNRVLEDARGVGKAVHGDFQLLRTSIEVSEYRTPHADICAELKRQMASGELLRTPEGILRREDALELAQREQLQLAMTQRAALVDSEALSRLDRALFQPASPDVPALALTPEQRDGVAAALSSESGGAIQLDTPDSAARVAEALGILFADRGLKAFVVSGLAGPVAIKGAISVERARLALLKLAPGSVVVRLDGPGTSSSAWLTAQSAAILRGVSFLGVSVAAQVKSEERHAPEADKPQVKTASAPAAKTKSVQLGSIRQRLLAARAEVHDREQQAPTLLL